MTRFPKLTTDEMTPAQREVAAEITAGPRGEVRGPFIALIHNAELARRIQALGEYLRWKTKLPPKIVELAVLVTARRWTCGRRVPGSRSASTASTPSGAPGISCATSPAS